MRRSPRFFVVEQVAYRHVVGGELYDVALFFVVGEGVHPLLIGELGDWVDDLLARFFEFDEFYVDVALLRRDVGGRGRREILAL